MTTYIALLRGVNLLGASTLKMSDLKAIAEELGLGSARTFIASGNLLFVSNEPEEKLRSMLEQRLQAHFGREVRVMLRTVAEMEEVVRATLPILPYDERAAEWHGEERARLERTGRVAPFVDVQIAAIAVTSGIPLVTANPTDFKCFKGLALYNWISG